MVDIHVIGAGGGSIAWMDDAGALKVGPRSAGADPGPGRATRAAAPSRRSPTPQICLHRLNPVALLEGRLPVDEAGGARGDRRARSRVRSGFTLEAAAEGVIRIANANMSRAIRSVSTERGYDLARVRAVRLRRRRPAARDRRSPQECGIPAVVVPQEPGTLCARGMLLTDISFDFVRSELARRSTRGSWQRVLRALRGDGGRGARLARARARRAADQSFRCDIDARYEGQNFEVIVPLGAIRRGRHRRVRAALSMRAHRREYGYDVPERAIEIVNCRLQAVGRVPKAPLRGSQRGAAGSRARASRQPRDLPRRARTAGSTRRSTRARRLGAGRAIEGPAVIEEMSSTTLLAPGQRARVDALGNLVIDASMRASDRVMKHAPAIRRLLDPIAMEVFSNRLLSITEDMNNTLVRSSFSTNIKERRDCSVALFDGRGRLIAQGTQIPLHLGSLSGGVDAVLRACPVEKMREGDAFICNDPYLANGTHLPGHHHRHAGVLRGARRVLRRQHRPSLGRRRRGAGLDRRRLAQHLRGGHAHPGDPHRARGRARRRSPQPDRVATRATRRSARSTCSVQIATNERGAEAARGLVAADGRSPRCARRSRTCSPTRAGRIAQPHRGA